MSQNDGIVAAAGQLRARPLGEADVTLAAIGGLVEQAAQQKADLVVLPECAYPSYAIGSVEAYRAAPIRRSHEYVTWLCDLARGWRIHIVSGLVEETGNGLVNAAVLIDDAGRPVGVHRKQFLWDRDNEYFVPGDRIEVYPTRLGRIGMLICAEARGPEIVATLSAAGAQLVAMPTCWVNTARAAGQFTNPQVEFLVEARAREFGLPFVCANKCGTEPDGSAYCGRTLIARADGTRAAEAPAEAESIVIARLALGAPRKAWIPPARRERLFSSAPAARPPQGPAPIKVAAVPGHAVERAEAAPELLFETLKNSGVRLAVANCRYEATAERLRSVSRPAGIELLGFPDRTDVYESGRAVGIRGLRTGGLSGQSARSFGSARALALEGAAVLAVFDAPADLALLRTRALENRVFVIAVAEDRGLVIAPDGEVLARTGPHAPQAAIAQIAPAAAADKCVAPRTDVFEQRRPATWAF